MFIEDITSLDLTKPLLKYRHPTADIWTPSKAKLPIKLSQSVFQIPASSGRPPSHSHRQPNKPHVTFPSQISIVLSRLRRNTLYYQLLRIPVMNMNQYHGLINTPYPIKGILHHRQPLSLNFKRKQNPFGNLPNFSFSASDALHVTQSNRDWQIPARIKQNPWTARSIPDLSAHLILNLTIFPRFCFSVSTYCWKLRGDSGALEFDKMFRVAWWIHYVK